VVGVGVVCLVGQRELGDGHSVVLSVGKIGS